MSLDRPDVVAAAELLVAGLTVQLGPEPDLEPPDVLLDARPGSDGAELAMYLAGVDLLALVVSHASHVLAVDTPELTARLGALVASHANRTRT